jgi:hypothetical protein
VADAGVVAGARLTDLVSLGVLASSVPRDVVDEVIAAAGRQAKRSDGKLPPHVMVYFVMAMALFAEEDYEEVAARLTDTLAAWGCWDDGWSLPSSGGITQARQRLGAEPLRELFSRVAVPVAGELTRGAFLGSWRLMAIDGFEWDVPDTAANGEEFGYGGSGEKRSAFPKARVVAVSECGSHAMVDAAIGGRTGKGSGWSRAGYGSPTATSTPGRTGVRRPTPVRTCCGGPKPTPGYRCWNPFPTVLTARC